MAHGASRSGDPYQEAGFPSQATTPPILRVLSAGLIAAALVCTSASTMAQSEWNDDAEACYKGAYTGEDAASTIDFCTRAIASGDLRGESLAHTYDNRGIKHRGQGSFEKAIRDHTVAIELHPDYWKYYGHRGLAFADSGNIHRALEDCSVAVGKEPRQPVPYLCRGWALENLGQQDRAIQDYRKGLELLSTEDSSGNRAWVVDRLHKLGVSMN